MFIKYYSAMFVQLSYSVHTVTPETHDTPVHPMLCYKTDKNLCSSSYKGNILSTNSLKYSERGWVPQFTNITQEHSGCSREYQVAGLLFVPWRDIVCHNSTCYTDKSLSLLSGRRYWLCYRVNAYKIDVLSLMLSVSAFNENKVRFFWTNSSNCIQSLKAKQTLKLVESLI